MKCIVLVRKLPHINRGLNLEGTESELTEDAPRKNTCGDVDMRRQYSIKQGHPFEADIGYVERLQQPFVLPRGQMEIFRETGYPSITNIYPWSTPIQKLVQGDTLRT